jgi:hypothetical protein
VILHRALRRAVINTVCESIFVHLPLANAIPSLDFSPDWTASVVVWQDSGSNAIGGLDVVIICVDAALVCQLVCALQWMMPMVLHPLV